jgi:hypothetical protein
MNYAASQTVSMTTPSSATTSVSTTNFTSVAKFESVDIIADLVGATGGTLDVYLQKKIDQAGTVKWVDWVHFAQLASGAAAIRHNISTNGNTVSATPVAVGVGTTASPGVALAAGTFAGGLPTDTVRIVAVGGVSTSAGAAIKITIVGHHPKE